MPMRAGYISIYICDGNKEAEKVAGKIYKSSSTDSLIHTDVRFGLENFL